MHDPRLLSQIRFAALAQQHAPDMDLAEGALLIADIAHPGLDHQHYHRRLDLLARAVGVEIGPELERLRAIRHTQRALATLVLGGLTRVLAEREGFTGNTGHYYDVDNSCLHVVLDTGLGLPITLSVVYLEIARRLGVPLKGVGLPAHFVVKWPLPTEEGGDLFLDPFHNGRIMDAAECREFVERLIGKTGIAAQFDPAWTRGNETPDILTRILHNLKAIYLYHGETEHALETVDRLVMLRPDLAEELRDRGLLRLAMGDPLLAAADLAAYADRAPQAQDLRRIRRRINAVREVHAKLN